MRNHLTKDDLLNLCKEVKEKLSNNQKVDYDNQSKVKAILCWDKNYPKSKQKEIFSTIELKNSKLENCFEVYNTSEDKTATIDYIKCVENCPEETVFITSSLFGCEYELLDVDVYLTLYLPNIYLAGRITRSPWRNAIINPDFDINQLYYRGIDSLTYPDTNSYFNEIYEFNDFVITGPHSISCDHGCFHTHGKHHASICEYELEDQPSQEAIVEACTRQINRSNFIFAYIEDLTAYGTFAELGYAYSLNKPIYILFKNIEIKKNLWFIDKMSRMSFVVDNTDNISKYIYKYFNKSLEDYKFNKEQDVYFE